VNCRTLILSGSAVLLPVGCSSQQQQAAIDTAICIVTVAPAVVTVAQGSGSNTTKAIAASQVALVGAQSVQPCRDAPGAISEALRAGNAVTVQPAP
jgi:hypothetical protein